MVSGFAPAPGSTGSDRSVSAYLPLSPGIVAALSTATICAPPLGSPRCSSAGVPAGDESAARNLSADNDASAAGAAIASAYGRLLQWLGTIMATTVSLSKQLLDVLWMAPSWD